MDTVRSFCGGVLCATFLAIPDPLIACEGSFRLIVQITADQIHGGLLDRNRSALTDVLARIENGGIGFTRGKLTTAFRCHFRVMQP